jgi:peptidoglycan hydrolase-like protein with peptidoglycan-binding domain
MPVPMRGPDVAAVQRALAAANIAVAPTGVYDGLTAVAVARFQKRSSLNINGVVDAVTWQKLGVKTGGMPSPKAPGQPSGGLQLPGPAAPGRQPLHQK